MKARAIRKAITMLIMAVACLGSVGCHHAFGSRTVISEGWIVDNKVQVYLIRRVSQYPAWADPELTYSDVTLEMRSGGTIIHRRTLGRREQREMRELGPIQLGRLEVRSASDHEEIWVIDNDARRVIASHHRATKATTGLGKQAPQWAKTDQGVVLERVP